jgi:hypothetical protein
VNAQCALSAQFCVHPAPEHANVQVAPAAQFCVQ